MPQRDKLERLVISTTCIACLLGIAWLALQAIGWFGVGLLGLFVMLAAIRFEIDGNHPVGPQMTPDLYASQFHKHGREHAAERAELRTRWVGQLGAARLALGCGALLTGVGFCFFFILQAEP